MSSTVGAVHWKLQATLVGIRAPADTKILYDKENHPPNTETIALISFISEDKKASKTEIENLLRAENFFLSFSL